MFNLLDKIKCGHDRIRTYESSRYERAALPNLAT